MKIVRLVNPDAVQYCPTCLAEQQENEPIDSAIYFEHRGMPIGLCGEHGVFEIYTCDLHTEESIATRNFGEIVVGANFGETVMICENHQDGTKSFMLGTKTEEGHIKILAKLCSAADIRVIKPE